MRLDWRNLRPGQLAGLLNSTPLGEVTTETRVRRNVVRAGLRVGDGKHVNFLGYAAWLLTRWTDAQAEPERPTGYEATKAAARERNAKLSAAGRDIAPLPEVVDPQRKARAEEDFRFFCESYFPETFSLAWSPDHLKVIAKIEKAVLEGGLFAMAMPRGSGKTSLAECACLWAILFGHREFVCLIGSDEGHAVEMLESVKTELDSNDLLLEDFPEAVYPIHCLEGIANRAAGQIFEGRRTHIGWTAKEIVLPTLPDSRASGAIIRVAGLTGRIRGMKFKRTDGKAVRPSLVVLDDPQTDESARSLSQCATRESILAGAVLGLAGPGRKISGIMPCTVIRPGDMADRILDRQKHPQWQGERTKMVYSFPTDEIARCLNLPYNIAACNSSGYNYASGRLDHQTYFKSIRVEQAHLAEAVLDRIFAAWVREAMLTSQLSVLRGQRDVPHQWFFDGTEHVDPAKEANAQATRLGSNTTTLAAEYARQGKDWETELRQRAKEKALMAELGLTEAQAIPEPQSDEEDDEEADTDVESRSAA